MDARERQHRDDQRECSELRERVAASERRAAQAERMARTNADEAQDRLRIARDLDAKDRDAAELRGLLRSAVRDKKLLEARVAELRSSAGRLEKQVGDRDGELLAARRATREAREAFVETNGRNGKEKGAVEYLKSVVRTALPPRGGAPDAATVRRLLPVLRSLLHLPHEQVESNIEALGSTGLGRVRRRAPGSGRGKRRRRREPAAAAELQRRADELAAARQLVKALEDDAEELRDELRRCNDESSARAQRDREALTSVEARLQALVEAVRRRSEGLGLLRAVASEAHKLATDAAAHQEELRRDAIVRQAAVDAGLDGEQLEYLRTTIVCFLSTPNAQLKRQLLPVLQQVPSCRGRSRSGARGRSLVGTRRAGPTRCVAKTRRTTRLVLRSAGLAVVLRRFCPGRRGGRPLPASASGWPGLGGRGPRRRRPGPAPGRRAPAA